MPVIIIAADSYRESQKIGKQAAEALGYRRVDRDLLGHLSRAYDIPEERLSRVLDEAAPSPLGGVFNRRWREHVARLQQAVLERLLEDNVVCCGLFAHLYVLGVSHVMRVRLALHGEGAGAQGKVGETGTEEGAGRFQKRYRYWSLKAEDQDQSDLGHYDLVINLDATDTAAVVQKLVEAVKNPEFRANTYSLNCLKDLELAARVRVRLMEKFSNVAVEANAATVVVRARLSRRSRNRQIETIKKLVRAMPGVAYVEVHPMGALLAKPAP